MSDTVTLTWMLLISAALRGRQAGRGRQTCSVSGEAAGGGRSNRGNRGGGHLQADKTRNPTSCCNEEMSVQPDRIHQQVCPYPPLDAHTNPTDHPPPHLTQ